MEWKKLFHGESQYFFMESFSRGYGGMRLPFSCAGVDEYGPASYTGPQRGPDEVATRLERSDPCGIETPIREVIFGFNAACGLGTGPTCDGVVASWRVARRLGGSES